MLRPILFNDEMVRAILDGRKTQTRRVIKPQPLHIEWFEHQQGWCARFLEDDSTADDPAYEMVECPYGTVGDRLWVREAYALYDWKDDFGCVEWMGPISDALARPHRIVYRASSLPREDSPLPPQFWRPSIFMPKAVSRVTVEITGVRVEKLQDVSEEDAKAEGAPEPTGRHGTYPAPWRNSVPGGKYFRETFEKLWDKINAKRGFGWKDNPWVWVIEFKRIFPHHSTPSTREAKTPA